MKKKQPQQQTNKQKKNQQKVRCERKSYNNQPSRMAEDGEEKSDLKITNYRGRGLGEGGKGGARGSEGVLPLKSLKSRNSSILGILRVLFMMVFFIHLSNSFLPNLPVIPGRSEFCVTLIGLNNLGIQIHILNTFCM